MRKMHAILLLCLLLIVAMPLAGCTKSSTPPTSAPVATDAPSTDAPAPTEKALETFKFSAMLNSRGVDDANSPAGKYWLEKMETLMGMKVEVDWKYVPGAEYDDKMKILLTSGDLPDYFLLPFLYNYTEMANEGFFLDLAKYNMVNYLKCVDEAYNGRLTAIMADGKMPVLYQVILPIVPADKTPNFLTNAMWNYTAFEREGIKLPETLDDVYNAAKAFKQKYPDSYPVNVNYQGVFAVFYAYHTYAHGDGAGTLYWDGKAYTFAGLQPQYKQGVEYLRKLYTEKLFDPEYIIETPDTVKTKMLNEKNFMLLNSWRTHATEYSRDSGDKKFVVAFIPDVPEVGKAWQTFSRANQTELTGWTVYAMSAETKNPELLTKFVDMQYLPEVYEIASWGIPGVTYNVDANGNKKFVDEFFQADDPSKVSDKYGLWNDRSGRANPGLRVNQDNIARELSFPLNDYTYYGGKYEEAPMQHATFFESLAWPNDYIPPTYNSPVLQLTPEENSEASSILTQITTFTSQKQAAFISGEEPMEGWDAFIETFKTGYDYQRVLDIYNAAAARYFEKVK